MKKLTSILILCAFFFTAFSQFNPEIIDTAKIWSSLEYTNFPPWYKKTYYHKFMNDTIINQMNYHKVWESEDENHLYWTHIGYIRSDENNNIFFMNQGNMEGLIYKFDVIQGDTFTMNNPFIYSYEFTVEVIETDSVFISPLGQYLKRIKLTDPNAPYAFEEFWVEGIGSLAGILWSGMHIHPLTGGLYDLLCQWQNDNLTYSNPDFLFCYNTNVSTSELLGEKPVLSVYPVPLTSQSFISLNSKDINNGILEIRDIFGNLMNKIPIVTNNKILLDRKQFKPGIYIIALFDGEKLITRKKLLAK